MSKLRQSALRIFAELALAAGTTVTAGNGDAATALKSARNNPSQCPKCGAFAAYGEEGEKVCTECGAFQKLNR